VKKDLLGKILAERERAERRRDAVAKEVREADRWEEYERSGNLLLAHLAEVRKGMREIVLEDFDGTSDVRIALDPTLPAAANAERYFTKAKKAKTARSEAQERLPELERRAARLRALGDELERRTTTEESDAFVEEYEEELRAMKLIEPAKGKELPPFRLFTVEAGYEVWVGKSSANNDLLTMKYARQNDLWFHVRGASGSHTVLKVKGGEAPPKGAIQQAASIAAYYSKMRNAGSVPVAYCERKYVRKPKGAAQGAVVLEREKTILVKPGLP
jgi:predicted ribosome quality control (RQC) complex YloA/Tae2 family protein